jgi:hypothetical protein
MLEDCAHFSYDKVLLELRTLTTPGLVALLLYRTVCCSTRTTSLMYPARLLPFYHKYQHAFRHFVVSGFVYFHNHVSVLFRYK